MEHRQVAIVGSGLACWNLYPVDLDLMVERAGLLGMTEGELRSKLHLLRGSA